jgi:hypothetical protein
MTWVYPVAALVFVAAGALGMWFGFESRERRAHRVQHDPVALEQHPEAAREDASTQLQVAWRTLGAFEGLPARLLALSTAGTACAQALRDAAGLGARWETKEGMVDPDLRRPLELRREAPRPGPIERWQTLDRAFDALLAALDGEDTQLAELADAWDALATAALSLGDAIHAASAPERSPCSFCSKRAREVRTVLTGPGVRICDECIALAVRLLEQELGDDWRAQSDG